MTRKTVVSTVAAFGELLFAFALILLRLQNPCAVPRPPLFSATLRSALAALGCDCRQLPPTAAAARPPPPPTASGTRLEASFVCNGAGYRETLGDEVLQEAYDTYCEEQGLTLAQVCLSVLPCCN